MSNAFVRFRRMAGHVPEIAVAIRTTAQWPAVVPAYGGVRGLRLPFEFRSRAGDRLVLHEPGDVTTLWHVWFGREYEVPPGARTIMDLGANIGAFAVLAARTAPAARLFCVEAFPETHERLLANIAANGLETRVRTTCCAAGGEPGIVRFDARSGIPGHQRTVAGLWNKADPGRSIDVPMRTLADLLDEAAFDEVDLLKVDIEGAEFSLFGSASDECIRRCRTIVLEWHPNRPERELWDRLESAGFRCTFRTPPGPDRRATFLRQ